MAGLTPFNRKRSRSPEEEDLPLSKKINNLHINHFNVFENQPQIISENGAQNPPRVENQWPPVVSAAVMDKPEPTHPWPSTYVPELNAVENPFYYESNKLLFELYLSRVHRTPY